MIASRPPRTFLNVRIALRSREEPAASQGAVRAKDGAGRRRGSPDGHWQPVDARTQTAPAAIRHQTRGSVLHRTIRRGLDGTLARVCHLPRRGFTRCPGSGSGGKATREVTSCRGQDTGQSGAGRCRTGRIRDSWVPDSPEVNNGSLLRGVLSKSDDSGLLRAPWASWDRRARPPRVVKVTKVAKVVILTRKQAYLQAGIRARGLPRASLLEIGAKTTTFVTFYPGMTTFTPLSDTFGPIPGFPGPDSS